MEKVDLAPPIIKMGKKLDAAQQEVAALGWTLLSNNYINLDTMSGRTIEAIFVFY